jgi:hypothetical protein
VIPREKLQREIAARLAAAKRAKDLREKTLTILSPKQRAFVEDKARRRVAVTSRQSGKTTGCLTILTNAAQVPNTEHLYIAPTREAARDPFWERLKKHCEDNKLNALPNETRLEMRFPDRNSIISLRGVPDIKRANRLLGPTRDTVVIDESASYPDAVLMTLVTKVIEPSLMVKKGSLILVGTPGLQPKGFFYETTKSSGYSHHVWGMSDNPVYGDGVAEIHAGILESNRWTRESPTFRREYLGEWCADTEAGVYRVSDANLYDTLPEGDWRYVLGVDFGYRDEAAFIVVGWREHDPTLYVVHEDSEQELLVDGYVSRLRQLIKDYNPIAVVADAGALGKTLVETLIINHGLPVEAADKRDKPVAIRQVNADLSKGVIRIKRDGLYDQMSTLRWHPDKIGLLEQPGMPNDRCDAFLYAYRRAMHYTQKPLPPKISHGSAEYFTQIEREIRDQYEREATHNQFEQDPWARD